MSTRQPHQLRTASAGALLGLAALILVAALLGGALAAIRANATIDNLGRDLRDAREQIDALRQDNARLADQNRLILDQNRVLVRYLRRHGLEVPQIVNSTPSPATTPAGAGTGTRTPKGTRPSGAATTRPGKPTPSTTTTPAPTGDGTGDLLLICELAPALCPLT